MIFVKSVNPIKHLHHSHYYISRQKQVIVNNKKSECAFIKLTTLEFHLQNFRFGHQKTVNSSVFCPVASGKELIDATFPRNKIIKNHCDCRYPVCFGCFGYAGFGTDRKLNSHLKNCVNPYK